MVEAAEGEGELVGERAVRMSRSSTIVTILSGAAFAIAAFAQAPRGSQGNAGATPPPPRAYPAPVNLKVLPGNLTRQQVHDVMKQWRGELGVRCNACHTGDPDNIVAGGPARSRFADDSKPMKDVARLMYTMTEQINRDFVAKVEGSGIPVTCGTCHRGRISPEPFAPALQGEPVPAHAPELDKKVSSQ